MSVRNHLKACPGQLARYICPGTTMSAWAVTSAGLTALQPARTGVEGGLSGAGCERDPSAFAPSRSATEASSSDFAVGPILPTRAIMALCPEMGEAAMQTAKALREHWAILTASMLGWALDAFDFTMLLFLVPHLRQVSQAFVPSSLVFCAWNSAGVSMPSLSRSASFRSSVAALGAS